MRDFAATLTLITAKACLKKDMWVIFGQAGLTAACERHPAENTGFVIAPAGSTGEIATFRVDFDYPELALFCIIAASASTSHRDHLECGSR